MLVGAIVARKQIYKQKKKIRFRYQVKFTQTRTAQSLIEKFKCDDKRKDGAVLALCVLSCGWFVQWSERKGI